MRPSIAVEDAVQTLGANIRNARLRRRLPQSVVAERAGVSLNTLSKVENDDAGLLMEEKNLPRRIRQKKKTALSS